MELDLEPGDLKINGAVNINGIIENKGTEKEVF